MCAQRNHDGTTTEPRRNHDVTAAEPQRSCENTSHTRVSFPFKMLQKRCTMSDVSFSFEPARSFAMAS